MNPGYFTYRPKGWTTISTNDSASVGAVAKYREIQGIWRTYATLDDFSYATGSLTQWNQGELEALRKNKFTEGQIIRISESGEFYLINKTVYDGPDLYPNEDIIIDAEEENQSYFDYFNDSAGALHEITASILIFPSSSQATTSSYINPLFISESAASYGFGSGDVTDAITGSLIKTASVNLNTITFTKGDTSTFDITVDTGSGGDGSGIFTDQGAYYNTSNNLQVTGTLLVSSSGGAFTDVVNDTTRITINAIPTESIFEFRNFTTSSFGSKASASIAISKTTPLINNPDSGSYGPGFGTGNGDAIFIDFQTGFVRLIGNISSSILSNDIASLESKITSTEYMGGTIRASSTDQFLLTASAIINDNDDLGLNIEYPTIPDPDNSAIRGIISCSVSESVDNYYLNVIATSNGTFANRIRIALVSGSLKDSDGTTLGVTSTNSSKIPGALVTQLEGGTAYIPSVAQESGSLGANIAVLDISGSNDSEASLKRMDLNSFLNEGLLPDFIDKIDSLIIQHSKAQFPAAGGAGVAAFDVNNDGVVGVEDLLQILAKFGNTVDDTAQALPAPDPSDIETGRLGSTGDFKEGLREAGGVANEGNNIITNGDIVIAKQSSGSLIIEGTTLINQPALINFQDKTGGTPGVSGSGILNNSGSLTFYSSSTQGYFEFDRSLNVEGSITASNFSIENNLQYNNIVLESTESIVSGSEVTIATFNIADYKALFIDYLLVSGSNRRAGALTATFDGDRNIEFTDVSTLDIGDTSDAYFDFGGDLTIMNLNIYTDGYYTASIASRGILDGTNFALGGGVYSKSPFPFTGSAAITGSLDITGSIVPGGNGVYDLGDATHFWRTASIEHIVTLGETIEFRDPANRNTKRGTLKLDEQGGLKVRGSSNALTIISASHGHFTGDMRVAGDLAISGVSNVSASIAEAFNNGGNVDTGSLTTTSSFNTFTSSIQGEVNTLTAATSSYLTSIPSTYFNSSLLETQNITKNFNYTSSLNVVEITSSVEGAIIDYRLTNLDSGSRVGTFMYAHDGTTLSYNDITIPGAGIGADPILSATLTGNIVSIDIENAAGFNFSGFAKKFSKLDSAVLEANPNISYLLDAYPSQNTFGAYSIRKLSQSYTGSAMRIRQSGSNAETNIGFDVNGNLDTAAIISHCGSNIGYVTIWYDQSGNNNNIYQNTAEAQPLIYNGSSIYMLNNKPYIRSSGKAFASDMSTLTPPYSYAGVLQATNIYARFGNSTSNIYVHNDGFYLGGTRVTPVESWVGYQSAFFATIDGSSSVGKAGRDGSTPSSVTMNSSVNFPLNILFARYNQASANNRYETQEFLLWDGSESSNLEGIMTNINNYYSIYDTGPLEDYPGAAAAYSVRQLTTAFTSSMNIRRASDNTEQVIGFTSAGDLDTDSIETFCSGTTCYVDTWYDQSGNGNHAEQSTAGSQPQIYNGMAVIEENGKPAIEFDGTGNSYESLINTTLVASATQSVFYVKRGSSNNGNTNSSVFGFPTTVNNTQLGIYYWENEQDQYGFNTWNADAWGITNASNLFYSQSVEFALVKNGNPSTSGVKLYYNGSEQTLSLVKGTSTDKTMANGIRIGQGGTLQNSQNFTGTFQEFIVYSLDKTNNVTNISTNINSYFNIY